MSLHRTQSSTAPPEEKPMQHMTIGRHYERWCELKSKLGLSSNEKLAGALLDCWAVSGKIWSETGSAAASSGHGSDSLPSQKVRSFHEPAQPLDVICTTMADGKLPQTNVTMVTHIKPENYITPVPHCQQDVTVQPPQNQVQSVVSKRSSGATKMNTIQNTVVDNDTTTVEGHDAEMVGTEDKNDTAINEGPNTEIFDTDDSSDNAIVEGHSTEIFGTKDKSDTTIIEGRNSTETVGSEDSIESTTLEGPNTVMVGTKDENDIASTEGSNAKMIVDIEDSRDTVTVEGSSTEMVCSDGSTLIVVDNDSGKMVMVGTEDSIDLATVEGRNTEIVCSEYSSDTATVEGHNTDVDTEGRRYTAGEHNIVSLSSSTEDPSWSADIRPPFLVSDQSSVRQKSVKSNVMYHVDARKSKPTPRMVSDKSMYNNADVQGKRYTVSILPKIQNSDKQPKLHGSGNLGSKKLVAPRADVQGCEMYIKVTQGIVHQKSVKSNAMNVSARTSKPTLMVSDKKRYGDANGQMKEYAVSLPPKIQDSDKQPKLHGSENAGSKELAAPHADVQGYEKSKIKVALITIKQEVNDMMDEGTANQLPAVPMGPYIGRDDQLSLGKWLSKLQLATLQGKSNSASTLHTANCQSDISSLNLGSHNESETANIVDDLQPFRVESADSSCDNAPQHTTANVLGPNVTKTWAECVKKLEKEIVCMYPDCNLGFTSSEERQDHVSKEHMYMYHPCVECGKRFLMHNITRYTQKVTRCHSSTEESSRNKEKLVKGVACDHCGIRCMDVKVLQEHKAISHPDVYTCRLCKKSSNAREETPTDPIVKSSSDLSTDPSVKSSSDLSTDPSVKSSSDLSTDPSVKSSSDLSTDPSVKSSSDLSTDPSVKSSSDLSTDPSVKSSSDLSTDPSVKSSSDLSTDPSVKSSSDLSTDPSVKFPSDLSTDPSAKSSNDDGPQVPIDTSGKSSDDPLPHLAIDTNVVVPQRPIDLINAMKKNGDIVLDLYCSDGEEQTIDPPSTFRNNDIETVVIKSKRKRKTPHTVRTEWEEDVQTKEIKSQRKTPHTVHTELKEDMQTKKVNCIRDKTYRQLLSKYDEGVLWRKFPVGAIEAEDVVVSSPSSDENALKRQSSRIRGKGRISYASIQHFKLPKVKVETRKAKMDNQIKGKKNARAETAGNMDNGQHVKMTRLKRIDVELDEHQDKFELITESVDQQTDCVEERPRQTYCCKMCDGGYTVADQHAMESHIADHLKGVLDCKVCGQVFSSTFLLRYHDQKHTVCNLACKGCGLQFNNKKTLESHVSSVHKIAAYACIVCDHHFTSSKKRRNHILKNHKNILPHCLKCGTAVLRHNLMNKSVKKVTAWHSTTVQCQLATQNIPQHIRYKHCGRDMDRKYYQRHPLMRHGERNVKCSSCDFSCAFGWELKKHMPKHTLAKSFKCDLCSFAAVYSQALKKHKQAHLVDDHVSCDTCNIIFLDGCGLEKHNRKEHGIIIKCKHTRGKKKSRTTNGGKSSGQKKQSCQEETIYKSKAASAGSLTKEDNKNALIEKRYGTAGDATEGSGLDVGQYTKDFHAEIGMARNGKSDTAGDEGEVSDPENGHYSGDFDFDKEFSMDIVSGMFGTDVAEGTNAENLDFDPDFSMAGQIGKFSGKQHEESQGSADQDVRLESGVSSENITEDRSEKVATINECESDVFNIESELINCTVKLQDHEDKYELITISIDKQTDSGTDRPRPAYCCKVCDGGYAVADKRAMELHLADHLEGRLKCNECGQVFANVFLMRSHNKTHVVGHNFTCEKCGIRFQKKIRLDFHLGHAHNVELFACIFCDLRFSTYKKRSNHVSEYHKEILPKCLECGNFVSRYSTVNNSRKVTAMHSKTLECQLARKKLLERGSCKHNGIDVDRKKEYDGVTTKLIRSRKRKKPTKTNREKSIVPKKNLCVEETMYKNKAAFAGSTTKEDNKEARTENGSGTAGDATEGLGPDVGQHVHAKDFDPGATEVSNMDKDLDTIDVDFDKEFSMAIVSGMFGTDGDAAEGSNAENCHNTNELDFDPDFSMAGTNGKFSGKQHEESQGSADQDVRLESGVSSENITEDTSEKVATINECKSDGVNIESELINRKVKLQDHEDKYELITISIDKQTDSGTDRPRPAYCCKVCDGGYAVADKRAMELHLADHLEGRLKCNECGQVFADVFLMRCHRKAHVVRRGFTCVKCGIRFQKKQRLDFHLDHVHNVQLYACIFCDLRFHSYKKRSTHALEHHKELLPKCLECGKFVFRESMVNSSAEKVTAVHSKTLACQLATKKVLERVQCKHCGIDVDRRKLKIHTEMRHAGERPIKCTLCNYSSVRQYLLNKHIRGTHMGGNRRFKCDLCNFSASSTGYVKRHQKVHSSDDRASCDICNITYKNKSGLNTHRSIKHADLTWDSD